MGRVVGARRKRTRGRERSECAAERRGWNESSRQRERRHVAHTPSRRRLRLRGAYQPPSIISMRISIFHPVFPKFMQTSGRVLYSPPSSSVCPSAQPPTTLVFCVLCLSLLLLRFFSLSLSLFLVHPREPTYEPFPVPPLSFLSLPFRTVHHVRRPRSLCQQPPSLRRLAPVSVSSVLFGMCVGPIHLTSSSGLSHHTMHLAPPRHEEVCIPVYVRGEGGVRYTEAYADPLCPTTGSLFSGAAC